MVFLHMFGQIFAFQYILLAASGLQSFIIVGSIKTFLKTSKTGQLGRRGSWGGGAAAGGFQRLDSFATTT